MSTKHVLAATCAGLLAVGGAQAAATFSQALVPGANTISDDDVELVLKYDPLSPGNYRLFNPMTDLIGARDVLVGAVGMTSFPTGALGTSASLYNQITALYAVEVTGTPTPLLGVACGAAAITTCTSFNFVAPTMGLTGLGGAFDLVNTYYATTIPLTYTVAGANSFAVVLEDNQAVPTAFDRSAATWNALFNSYEDGAQVMTLDLISANGDYFFTNAPANVLDITIPPPGANAGSFGGQSTISWQNIPGWLVGPSMTITGNIQAPNGGPASIWSDSTYRFDAQRVPEPSSLALIGLALAAAGVVGGRRGSRRQA